MVSILLQIISVLSYNLGDAVEATMNFVELSEYHGFKAMNYTVTTPDGYILTLHRISGTQDEPVESGKPIAYMQHGLLDSSDCFIINDADIAPAFTMVRNGFDVWLGNSRGNKYSRMHATLNPDKDAAYWDFSWQEMMEYDLPTFIDFVLKHTGKKNTVYIGHSQGTTQMFAKLASNPDFIDNISVFIALAPVASAKNLNVPLIGLLTNPVFVKGLQTLGVHEFLPAQKSSVIYHLCDLVKTGCADILGIFADMQVNHDNIARMPVIFAHFPAGTSLQDVEYFEQMYNYKEYKMQKYDYGETENQQRYGQATPPIYDLTKIRGPLALFFGLEDRLANPIDGKWLVGQLNSDSIVYLNQTLPIGHEGFLWGENMDYYSKVVEIALEYSKNQ